MLLQKNVQRGQATHISSTQRGKSLFPGSDVLLQKNVQRGQATHISSTQRGQPSFPDVYGVSWDKGESPTLTRTDVSIGMVANAGVDAGVVVNDFDNIGIWKGIVQVTDTLSNVFMRIPKFYIRKTDGVGYKTWQVSKTPYPGFYLPWCFWDFTNSRELPYIDVGKYPGSKADTKLQSVSGAYPLVNTNIANMRVAAVANNAGGLLGYQQLDLHVVDLLQTLFYIEFATLDSQAIMAGYTTGQYLATHVATVAENAVNRVIVVNAQAALYAVGRALSCGTSLGDNQIFTNRTITAIDVYDASNKAISFDGAAVNIAVNNIVYNSGYKNGKTDAVVASSGSYASNSTGKHSFKYRGIENLWGNVWQFVDGLNITNRQGWIAKNAADYASNVFAAPYEQLGYVNGGTDGYFKTAGYDANFPFAALPTSIDAAHKYYKDYYYQGTGQLIARLGGSWYYSSYAGFSYWNLSSSSSFTYVAVGGRLLRKPL
jgi:hypothetical protein